MSEQQEQPSFSTKLSAFRHFVRDGRQAALRHNDLTDWGLKNESTLRDFYNQISKISDDSDAKDKDRIDKIRTCINQLCNFRDAIPSDTLGLRSLKSELADFTKQLEEKIQQLENIATDK